MRRLVAVLLGLGMVAMLVPGPAAAEERTRTTNGFEITDSGFLAGAAGDTAPVDLQAGPNGEVNAGSYKEYSFVIDDAHAPAHYETDVSYANTHVNNDPTGHLCTADLDMRLVDEDGNVVNSDLRTCDPGELGRTGSIGAGSYTLGVWAVHGASEFDLNVEVFYNS